MVTALKGVRAVKTSQRLLQRAHDVADFRDAYLALMQVMHISQDEYMGSDRLRPRPGREDEAMRLMPKVSRAAGKATIAAGDQTRILSVTQFGQTTQFDPISNWQRSIDMPDHLPAKTVLDCCEAIIGGLEAKANEASAVEGTLVGRIASFVGFPARVRAAVAIEHPGMAKAAFGVGVVGQVVIGVVIVVLGAGALAGIVALWNMVV